MDLFRKIIIFGEKSQSFSMFLFLEMSGSALANKRVVYIRALQLLKKCSSNYNKTQIGLYLGQDHPHKRQL